MISFDVETDINQHEIKQLVAISSYHQIFIRSIYLRNLKHAVKQACVFHVILLDIPSNSAKNRTRKGGEMVGGGGVIYLTDKIRLAWQKLFVHNPLWLYISKNSLSDFRLGTELLWKKSFLRFWHSLILTLLKEIWRCPKCQISWKLEHISILGPNLPEFIILGQYYQFQILYS